MSSKIVIVQNEPTPIVNEEFIKTYDFLIRKRLQRFPAILKQYEGDIDEVVNEVFVEIVASIKNFRGDSKFSTYANSIIKNTLCTINKKITDCPPIVSLEEPVFDNQEDEELMLKETIEDKNSNFERMIEIQDLIENLIIKARLTTNETYVIRGIFFYGLSQQEIAKEIGVSEPYISRLKTKAWKKLTKASKSL